MTLIADFGNPAASLVTYQRMRQMLLDQGGGIQEGVVGSGDFKVTQRGAGANMSVDIAAGLAWVKVDTGTRNGIIHVLSDAVTNQAINAAHATLPRIDRVGLRYNDSAIPTGSGDTPTVYYAAGTPTASAQAANPGSANYLAGAVTPIPSDVALWSDVLVPAASSSVTNANIVDRRQWARGAYFRDANVSGDLPLSGSAITSAFRIECSGAPLRVRLIGSMTTSGGGLYADFVLLMDGTAIGGSNGETHFQVPGVAAAAQCGVDAAWEFVPTAGSHVFQFTGAQSASTVTILRSAGAPLICAFEEIVRPNASNT